MRAALRILWIVPFAALAGAALGQTTGTATAAPGQLRGPGLPAVPNNGLPPITSPSVLSDPGSVTRPSIVTTPSTGVLSGATPITGSITPGISTTTPGVASGATSDAFINLPPPVVNSPIAPAPVGPCPSGMTFC
jgi:hypothetical protein